MTSNVIASGEIDVNLINVGTRFRTDNSLDEEFLESIRSKGILQPITIDQNFTLVAGGRRLAASKLLDLTSIPYVQRRVDGELDLRECELIENSFRKDFDWLDRNKLVSEIHKLMKEKHGEAWSQRSTADLLNKSVGGINRHLSLSKSIAMFPDLAKCKTEDDAVKLFRRLAEKVVVKDLVRQQMERSNTEADGSSVEASPGEKPSPLGVTLARSATHHYRIGRAEDGLQDMLDNGLKPPIALVEIDPPYAIDLVNQKKGEEGKGLGEYNEIDASSYPAQMRNILTLCMQVTPANCRFVIWFGQEWYQTFCDIFKEVGLRYDVIPGVWTKPSGQTNSPDLYLARAYESFFIAWKGDVPIAKRGRANVFSYKPDGHASKYHPTQRPQELMEEILLTFAYPGAIVLVPYLGSGSTIRAAYRCGMRAFGWDLSEVYKEGFLAAVETDIQGGRYNTTLTLNGEE